MKVLSQLSVIALALMFFLTGRCAASTIQLLPADDAEIQVPAGGSPMVIDGTTTIAANSVGGVRRYAFLEFPIPAVANVSSIQFRYRYSVITNSPQVNLYSYDGDGVIASDDYATPSVLVGSIAHATGPTGTFPLSSLATPSGQAEHIGLILDVPSPTGAIGIISNENLANKPSLIIQGDLLGDFQPDNRIDGADFLAWQRKLGAAGDPTDVNGDGVINGLDLIAWKRNFGLTSTVSAIPSPEPAGCILFEIVAIAFYSRLGGR